MKAELLDIPGKGICILISGISLDDLSRITELSSVNEITKSPFTDAYKIADEIRKSQKIAAIKECRAQTGWDLRQAKEYIDRYMIIGISFQDAADKFIDDHTYKNEKFLNIDEFKI